MRVLVIGDGILDVYRDCVFKKRCPEDPQAPAVIERSRECLPGGAANVAVNLAALAPGCQVDLITVLNEELARAVKFGSRNTVDCHHSVLNQPLIKERIIFDDELVVRVDNSRHVTSYAAERISVHLREYFSVHEPDLILLSDYGSQTVNDDSMADLLRRKDRLVVDTKSTDLSIFGSGSGRTLACKLNTEEHRAALEVDHSPEQYFKIYMVTRGSAGVSVMIRNDSDGSSIMHTLDLKGHPRSVVDVNGCGDTFLAGFAAGLQRSRDLIGAAEFGNAAAATVVSKRRTAVADLEGTFGLLGMEYEVGTRSTCADHRDSAPRTV